MRIFHNDSAPASNPNGIAYPSPGLSRNAGLPRERRPDESPTPTELCKPGERSPSLHNLVSQMRIFDNDSAPASNPNGIAYPSPGLSRNAGLPRERRPDESPTPTELCKAGERIPSLHNLVSQMRIFHNDSAPASNPNGIAYPSPGLSRNAGLPRERRPDESPTPTELCKPGERTPSLHNLVEVARCSGCLPKVAQLRRTTLGFDAESRWDSENHLNRHDFSISQFNPCNL
jgi:hypothetical protein